MTTTLFTIEQSPFLNSQTAMSMNNHAIQLRKYQSWSRKLNSHFYFSCSSYIQHTMTGIVVCIETVNQGMNGCIQSFIVSQMVRLSWITEIHVYMIILCFFAVELQSLPNILHNINTFISQWAPL